MLFWAQLKVTATFVALALLVGGAAGMVLIAKGANHQPAAEIRGRSPNPVPPQPTTQNSVITGRISQVGNGSIAIRRQNGQTVTVSFNAATLVKVNDQRATVAELKAGLDAAAFLEKGQPASEIRVYTPGTAPVLR